MKIRKQIYDIGWYLGIFLVGCAGWAYSVEDDGATAAWLLLIWTAGFFVGQFFFPSESEDHDPQPPQT